MHVWHVKCASCHSSLAHSYFFSVTATPPIFARGHMQFTHVNFISPSPSSEVWVGLARSSCSSVSIMDLCQLAHAKLPVSSKWQRAAYTGHETVHSGTYSAIYYSISAPTTGTRTQSHQHTLVNSGNELTVITVITPCIFLIKVGHNGMWFTIMLKKGRPDGHISASGYCR